MHEFPGHRPQGCSVNPAADSSDAFPPGAVGVPPGSRLLRRPVRRTRPSIRTRRRRSLARTGVVGTVVQVNGRAVGTASAASAPRIRNRPGGSAEEAMAAQPLGQPLDEGGEHGPVGPVHAWSWVGATEHRDLMSQHEELDVLGRRSKRKQDQSQHLPEDQVQRSQRHGGDHAAARCARHTSRRTAKQPAAQLAGARGTLVPPRRSWLRR